MIADLRRYRRMKDSGVPWLGDVPEHWEAARLKGHLVRNDSGVWGDDSDPHGTFVLRSTEQTVDGGWRITNPAKIRLPEAQSEIALLRTGDLVVTKSSGSSAHIGKTSLVSAEVASLRCCFSNFMQRLRVDGVTDPSFLWRLLNSPVGREQLVFQSTTTTGLGNLNGTILGNSRFPFPPLAEQAAIVRFLDHADRRIRRYIRAKQKLIQLLEEQKQAIIHHAVTRGLDPNVRLRPSGVGWLGDVPEHWEVLALRRRWSVTDCKHLTVPFVQDEDGIPLASVREVQSFELSLATAKRTSRESYETLIEGGRGPRKGDLIYCRNVSVGAAAIVATDDALAMGQDVCLIRSGGENQRYLNYFLRSSVMRHQLSMLLVGSTFNRVNVADIKSLTIVVPTRAEQDAIAAFLDGELKDAARAQALATAEISLLREYRTRLISDVVTGKLDVREAAARLPDEGEETDPLDEADALSAGEEEFNDGPDALPAEAEV